MEYLEELWSSNTILENDIVIIHNIRFYHSNDAKNYCKRKNIIIKYVPPISLDITLIKNIFSIIKSQYPKIRPFPSTKIMIKEYIGQVIIGMNEDPTTAYEKYFETMMYYLSVACTDDQF